MSITGWIFCLFPHLKWNVWSVVFFLLLFRKCQSEIFHLSYPHVSFSLSKCWLKVFAEFCLHLPTVPVNLVPHFSSRYLHARIHAAFLLPSHCRKNAEADCREIWINMNSLEERAGRKTEEKNRETQRWYKGMTRQMSICLWSMHPREVQKWLRVVWGATAGSEERKLSETHFLFFHQKECLTMES